MCKCNQKNHPFFYFNCLLFSFWKFGFLMDQFFLKNIQIQGLKNVNKILFESDTLCQI